MNADIFITRSFIDKLIISSEASLLSNLFYIEQRLIGDCLGQNDDLVPFSDEQLREELADVLIEIGKREKDIFIRNKILQILLFICNTEKSLTLAEYWASDVFHHVQEDLSLLKTILIILERNNVFLSKDKNKWLPNDIILSAQEYLSKLDKP